MKKENGITMITLAVTIIVLIILAGVSINMLVGENGIITMAQKAKENIELAQIEEEKQLNNLYGELVNAGEGIFDDSMGDAIEKLENFKKIIATAITNEGVVTSETDTAETMAENIAKILEEKLKNKTATASNVLEGKTFSSSAGEDLVGTMPNNGTISANLKGGESYVIPEGYTSGGTITAEDSAINIENLTWEYVTVTGTPTANSNSMTWNLTSIPNYQKLELHKTLNPVMVSSFDMANWNTSYSRSWSMQWGYTPQTGILSVTITSQAGPSVQYGTGIVNRTVGVYYLKF